MGAKARPRRLDRPARARPRAAAPGPARSSACTTSRSRTPSTPHQRPKLEQYGDALFIVARTAQLIDGRIAFGETHLFVGRGYVVSVRHGASTSYARGAPALRELPDGARQGRGLHPLRASSTSSSTTTCRCSRRSRTRSRRSRTSVLAEAADRGRHRAALHAAPRPAAAAQRRRAAGRGLPPARPRRPAADRRRDAPAVPRRHRPHPQRAGEDRHPARGAGLRLRGEPDDRPGQQTAITKQARRLGRHPGRADGGRRHLRHELRATCPSCRLALRLLRRARLHHATSAPCCSGGSRRTAGCSRASLPSSRKRRRRYLDPACGLRSRLSASLRPGRPGNCATLRAARARSRRSRRGGRRARGSSRAGDRPRAFR